MTQELKTLEETAREAEMCKQLRARLYSQVQEVNARLEAAEPKSITYDYNDKAGYKPQYIIDAMNEVFGLGNWGYNELYNELEDGVMVAKVEVWIAGIEYKPVGYGQGRVTKGDVGDARKSANTDAWKKGFSLFSICARAYRGDLPSKEETKAREAAASRMIAEHNARIKREAAAASSQGARNPGEAVGNGARPLPVKPAASKPATHPVEVTIVHDDKPAAPIVETSSQPEDNTPIKNMEDIPSCSQLRLKAAELNLDWDTKVIPEALAVSIDKGKFTAKDIIAAGDEIHPLVCRAIARYLLKQALSKIENKAS